MDTMIFRFFAMVLGIGGVACFVTALRWRRIQRGFRPDNELRVYGKLIQSQTTKNYTNRRLNLFAPTHLHDFTYSYEVDGKTYTVTDELLRKDFHIPSGTEIICQRSDPRHCYIPGLTKPPREEDHHPLYFIGALFLLGMLWFLSILP